MFSNIEETYVHPLDYNKKYTMRKRFIEFDFHNDFYKKDLAYILLSRRFYKMDLITFRKIYSNKYGYQVYNDCFFSDSNNRFFKNDSSTSNFVRYYLQRKQQKWI